MKKIRRITYSYRQYHRYKEAQQEEKKKEQQSQDVSQHDVEQSSSNKESNDEQYEGKNKIIERRMNHE